MKNNKRFPYVFLCFWILILIQVLSGKLLAQDAFMGHFTTQPWVTSAPTNFASIRFTIVGATTSNTRVCNSPGNSDINALVLSSNDTHYLQIDIPEHDIKNYIINLLGSSSGSNNAIAGIVYASDPSFADGTIIDAVPSPPFLNNTIDCPSPVVISPPLGTKSVRIYRRINYWAADKRISTSTSPSSGRTQVGVGQTFRLANVQVWATATPIQQTQNITFTNINTTNFDVNFTRGNGTHVVVFAKEGSGAITNPIDNTVYTASNDWKIGSPTGTQLGSSGYFCVYNETGTNFKLNNLKPNTQYILQAFEYTSAPAQLRYLTTTAAGNPATVTTRALSAPTLETTPVTDILSNKATVGSVNLYDGGLPITEKGLVWSTTENPTVSLNSGKLNKGDGSSNFSDFIKGLTPNTKYFVRAYAINSLGISYGNQKEFTTAGPVPVLVAIPGNINFGENFYGENSLTISYNLTGQNLTPANGTITITAPTGFLVSLRGNSDFGQTVTLPYTNGRINNTAIYVQLPTTKYGSFTGEVIHSGAGVLPVDADIVSVTGEIKQSPDELSNRGTDFWLGFGYQEKMSRRAGDSGEAKLSLYISATNQPATVVVEIPGQPGAPGFPKTVNIPANTVVEVTGFPTGDPNNNLNTGGFPDTRLYATGVQNKGIHVYSVNEAPISLWMYSYTGGNSAAGAMLFPSNTWGSEYIVQSYGATSNNSNPNSFFFVIAAEDNTEIEFTPSNDILNADPSSLFTESLTAANVLYKKGLKYSITLNKGQIFNAMGFIDATGKGLDLTGTLVKTSCEKKIAVFGGNGRSFVTPPGCSASSGSDHLIQQMFPTAAWGSKYLTVPTKHMEINLFRVIVKDPTTVVKRNGIALTGLINGIYYEFATRDPMSIEADKPISVIQYIVTGSCGGAVGTGEDPEMIILSPVQQAINNVTVYSSSIKSSASLTAQGHYINVIIGKAAITNQSFKLGNIEYNSTTPVNIGSATGYGNLTVLMKDAFKVHPQDPNYYYARFKVEPARQYTISSDYDFVAIAYGMGGGESYGYNAGTAVKNLSSIKIAVNPAGIDTSSTSVRTGKNNPVRLRIALPHIPSLVDKIVWDPGSDSRISPAGVREGEIDSNTGKAKYDGTIDIDGRTFYIYSSPILYQFSEEGISKVTATALGTFASDCGGEDIQKITIIVGRDNINFDFQTSCGNPTVSFTNNSTAMPGSTITNWTWDFGDGTSSNLQNPPPHTYAISGGYQYMVKLTTKNNIGTITTDSLLVDFSGGVEPKFTTSKNQICAGETVNFDPSLSEIKGTTSGTPVKWTWKFGLTDSIVVNGAVSPVQQHTFLVPGKYPVELILKTSTNCENRYVDTVTVGTSPISVISAPLLSCITDSIAFKDMSTVAVGAINQWLWTFDDGTTSTLQNPKHKWLTPGKHTATLKVTSLAGCEAVNTATHEINILPLPIADFTYTTPLCKGTKVVFKNASTLGTTEATLVEQVWDFGDGSPLVTKTTADTLSHIYPTAGSFTVKLWVKTSAGCVSTTVSKNLVVNPLPEPDFTVSEVCVPTGKAQFTATNKNTVAISSWLWDFGDGNISNQQNPLHTYTRGGAYNVKLTATSAAGCPVTITKEVLVYDAPTTSFTVENINNLCSINPVKITDVSAINGYGSISLIEIYWDFARKPLQKLSFNNPASRTVYENLYPNPTTTPSTTYRILIKAFTNAGCYTESYQDVVLHAMPEAQMSSLAAVCQDTPPFNFTQGKDNRNLPGNGIYSGNGVTNNSLFSPLLAGPGTHRIKYTYTTLSGCESVAEQDILVYPAPIVKQNSAIIYVKDGASLRLEPQVLSGTGLSYNWFPATYLDNPGVESPLCTPSDDITYTLIVSSAQGCRDTVTYTINLLREIIPPNTFTPNGDQINDLWEVKYLETYPGATVEIYNRYGKKVFYAISSSAMWDGKLNGEDLPVGTYYYIIDLKNGSKIITGSVTIIR